MRGSQLGVAVPHKRAQDLVQPTKSLRLTKQKIRGCMKSHAATVDNQRIYTPFVPLKLTPASIAEQVQQRLHPRRRVSG